MHGASESWGSPTYGVRGVLPIGWGHDHDHVTLLNPLLIIPSTPQPPAFVVKCVPGCAF
jgi:hypothetical protein